MINLEKFIVSLLSTPIKDSIISALQDQGLEYKEGKLETIKDIFPFDGCWYMCIEDWTTNGQILFAKGNLYCSKNGGLLTNSGETIPTTIYSFKKYFRLATEKEIKTKLEFKVGDWIVFGKRSIGKITEIVDSGYRTTDGFASKELEIHRWTIYDAIPGDIIYTKTGSASEKKDIIFMFKGIGERSFLDEPCIEHYCYLCSDGFYIPGDTSFMGVISDHNYPATDKQCVALLQMMMENGYNWNATQKVFKNINDKPVINVEKLVSIYKNSLPFCGEFESYGEALVSAFRQGILAGIESSK